MNDSLVMNIDFTPYFNYTFYSNGYSFLQRISIDNVSSRYDNLTLKISSSLGLFKVYEYHIDSIDLANKYSQTKFDLAIDLPFLKKMTEKDIDAIQVVLVCKEEVLCSEIFTIEVLPIDYFGGLQCYPQLLTAYVLSNNPKVYEIKAAAIDVLEQNKMSAAFEGYQSKDKERVLQMVSSLYKSIQNLGLIYSAMPASFEQQGQRIRLVDRVLETKFGNCIDISLLFAACLEAINLNPILILTKGHSFVGVWLDDQCFDSCINFDQAAISKRIASGNKELIVVESTHLCRGNSLSISDAMKDAERQVLYAPNFLLSIDIKSARTLGIHPISLIHEGMSNEDFELSNIYSDAESYESYDVGPIYDDLLLSDGKVISKQKLWERKLLDLSLRNSLLNLRYTKSMLQLVDVNVNTLEDTLADGKSFSIQADSSQSVLRKYNLYFGPLHSSDRLYKLAEEECKYNRLLTYYHEDDLNAILTNLYRNSKLAEEENGRSTLYLGVGLLKWFEPKNNMQARFAPILLIPVELNRRSVNSKFVLRSREEDTMINITLLEYLKQEFKLNLDQLEQLPMDDRGVDVTKVLAIIRNAVLNLRGWDVLEQTVLGIFSFNKLLLWQDISKFSDEIQKSPIVKSLIDGVVDQTLQDVISVVDTEHLAAHELTLPIPTDNSQLNAIKNANLNKTFILHGPPGTGKSQTITNIIADALANDKKVLFVAAKKAALDVVHNRLEAIGLGPFCLELHSNKAKKSDILHQFDNVLQVPKYQMSVDYMAEAKRLDERKSGLRQYVAELHQQNSLEWSLYDTISFLENNKIVYKQSLKIDINTDELSVTLWNKWNDWLVPFNTIVSNIGSPLKHPLSSVKLDHHQFENNANLTAALDQYIENYTIAEQAYKQFDVDLNYIFEYSDIFQLLKAKKVNIRLFTYYFEDEKSQLFKAWIELQTKKNEIERKVLNNFNRSILHVNFDELEIIWNQSKHSWFLPRWFRRYKVKNQLVGYAKTKLNEDEVIDCLFESLPSYRSYKSSLDKDRFASFSNLVHTYMDGEFVNTGAIQEDFNTIGSLDHLLKQAKVYSSETWLKLNLEERKIFHQLDRILAMTDSLVNSSNQLMQFLTSIPSIEFIREIKGNLSQLEDQINYNIYKKKAQDLQLTWFIQLVEEESIDIHNLIFEFEKVLRLNHFIERLYGDNSLNGFDGSVYESLISQYKKLHKEFVKISNSQLIMKLSTKIPNGNMQAVQSSEIGFLQRAIRSKGRGLSIRKLFDQIPSLIPRLKPCMLMSPISVAQYFDVNKEHFDVVIFDEASQLPTSEAISSLARAKQAIIVGDPKQMPPTSFFSSNKIDEDNFEIEDLESILEDALSLSIPSNYLLKHYRSKHESLISFSNKNFYDNKLMTFPSPDDLSQKVTFQYVEGHYDKGNSRTNKNEAIQVVAYIKEHLEQKNAKSLGIVTFSQTQQSLIEDLIQKLFQEYPTLEEFALNQEESIFIKNLENVQGDERDIILFSIGYGPDEFGKVSMNFGPLNREGGWRRLNVAITRARYEMKVFSSLRADQIDLNRTDAEGIKALKGFLHFSEKGNLEEIMDFSNQEKRSLIDAIAAELIQIGYQVKLNIGTSGYKVDIGVVHPQHEKQYILGILLDGENYFNINNTNDRELLTPSVLKSLGWNIFRVWTLDWVKHKERILDKIIAKINSILDKQNKVEEIIDVVDVPVQKEVIKIEKTIIENVVEEEEESLLLLELNEADSNSNNKRVYEVAKLKPIKFANAESVYYPENRIQIEQQIAHIISAEAPISTTLLIKKILKFWNISRGGPKINEYLLNIINNISSIRKTQDLQEFLWNESNAPTSMDYYRDNTIEKRSIEDISSEEISVAAMEFMINNISMTKEDLIRLVSRAFGFLKVGTQIEAVVSHAIGKLVEAKKLDLVGEKLYIPL